MRTTILSLTLLLFAVCGNLRAQQADTLSTRQQSIVAIAANTATGDLENLKTALARGLDNGMTVNEVKEVLVHAYAYCGFPRSLRALRKYWTSAKRRASPTSWDVTHRPSATAATSTPVARSCSKS